jgi:cytochrome b subunit of formate dehydrogenase
MNPILLFIALLITGYLFKLKKFNYKLFFVLSFILTAIFATIFFKIPENYYLYWILLSLITSIYLFTRKFENNEPVKEDNEKVNKLYLPYLPL